MNKNSKEEDKNYVSPNIVDSEMVAGNASVVPLSNKAYMPVKAVGEDNINLDLSPAPDLREAIKNIQGGLTKTVKQQHAEGVKEQKKSYEEMSGFSASSAVVSMNTHAVEESKPLMKRILEFTTTQPELRLNLLQMDKSILAKVPRDADNKLVLKTETGVEQIRASISKLEQLKREVQGILLRKNLNSESSTTVTRNECEKIDTNLLNNKEFRQYHSDTSIESSHSSAKQVNQFSEVDGANLKVKKSSSCFPSSSNSLNSQHRLNVSNENINVSSSKTVLKKTFKLRKHITIGYEESEEQIVKEEVLCPECFQESAMVPKSNKALYRSFYEMQRQAIYRCSSESSTSSGSG